MEKLNRSVLFFFLLYLVLLQLALSQEKNTPTKSEPIQLKQLELTFENGRYYQVVKKGERRPQIRCRIVTQGAGTLSGSWMINGQVVLPLQHIVSGFQDTRLPQNKLPSLPINDSGTHHLSLQLTSIQAPTLLPVLRYFVSIEPPLTALSPEEGQPHQLGEEITLKWSAVKGEYQYQLAISQIPFQFLNNNQFVWQEPVSHPEWVLKTDSLSQGQVYWMIRAISSSQRVVSASEINYFILHEKSEPSKEVIK